MEDKTIGMQPLMATVAAVALAAPVVAQDQTKPQPEAAAGTEAAPPVATESQPAEEAAGQEMVAEEATPPADMKFIEVQDDAQFLAYDEVIGQNVVNVMDEEVGEIADLVMDPDQKLVGVVLSVGGFLGVGDKWVAVPVEQIQFPAADQPARLLVAVTPEQLENAPDFTTKEAIEARRAAEEAQRQQQVPPPATTTAQ